MESYQGQLVSESDTSDKRRNRAAKLTGYSHDTLSKAKQVYNIYKLSKEVTLPRQSKALHDSIVQKITYFTTYV